MIKSQTISNAYENEKTSSTTTILLTAIFGFLCSMSNIAGALSPINVAIVAGTSLPAGISAFAGSLAGYFISRNISGALAHICTMVIVLIFKLILIETKVKDSPFRTALLATFSGVIFLIFGIVFNFILVSHAGAIDLLAIIAQSMLCASAVYFGIFAYSTVNREGMVFLTGQSGVSLAILYVIGIASLTSINLLGFNLARIVSVAIILLAIKKYRHLGGAICGILSTCGIILASSAVGANTVLLATAGMIAGLFQQFGSIPTVTMFLVSNAVGLLAFGVNHDTFPMMLDSCIGAIAFLCIPQNLTSTIHSFFGLNYKGADTVTINSATKLKFAAKTISDIRTSLSQVTKAMLSTRKCKDIQTEVSDNVCAKCSKKIFCWTSQFDRTNDAFNSIVKTLDDTKSVTTEMIDELLIGCPRAHMLAENFNEISASKSYDKQIITKMREFQGTLTSYFYTTEHLLSDFSDDLLKLGYAEYHLSSQLNNYLALNVSSGSDGCVFVKRDGRITVEIFAPKHIKIDRVSLCSDISEIVDREMAFPEIVVQDEIMRINLWEQPDYSLEIGASQISSERGVENGDTYEYFYEKHGEASIILSDGMGSGKRAKLDSLLTSTFLSKLLKSGVGYNTAIEMINSALKIKGWDESFATIDLTRIDLYSGQAEIIKSGAAATYVYRNEKLAKIEADTLPVGILDEVSPAVMNAKLMDGDIILFASDGVSTQAEEPIRKTIMKNPDLSAKALADKLSKCALNYDISHKHDDITIITAIVSHQV